MVPTNDVALAAETVRLLLDGDTTLLTELKANEFCENESTPVPPLEPPPFTTITTGTLTRLVPPLLLNVTEPV